MGPNINLPIIVTIVATPIIPDTEENVDFTLSIVLSLSIIFRVDGKVIIETIIDMYVAESKIVANLLFESISFIFCVILLPLLQQSDSEQLFICFERKSFDGKKILEYFKHRIEKLF